MKKLIIAIFLLTGIVATKEANAQVSVNINIGNQPAWGPTGYDYVNFCFKVQVKFKIFDEYLILFRQCRRVPREPHQLRVRSTSARRASGPSPK